MTNQNPYKVAERIDWERGHLALGRPLNSTIIREQFGCTVRTAWRDTKYLKDFYGSKLVYNHRDRAFYLEVKPVVSKDDLRAKYGRSLKAKALYNRAIRAECPGGPDLLDLLELVSGWRDQVHPRSHVARKLTIIEDRLQTVRERMLIDVRNRWGLLDDQ